MTISRISQDIVSLPYGLLSIAKSHLRIDGIYDDHLIVTKLQQSINWFERYTGVSVNPVTYVWKPAQNDFNYLTGSAPVPVSPVNGFSATVGVDNVTDNYEIGTDSLFGVEINTLIGTWVSGLMITIPSGATSAIEIDPGITDIVLRYLSHIYEHREILVPGMEAQTPGWANDVMATYWKPRV
jgi:hypothetical protein